MKLLIVILTSFMFFGCIEEGTIVYDQDYPEAHENIGGSGSGNDRVPGDGAGSAGGSSDGNGSDGAGSTGTSGDGEGTAGGDTSTGSSDGSGSTGGDTGSGSTGGDTSSGSSDGSGSAGDGTGDGADTGSGDTGGDTGSGSTGGTSTGDGNGSDGGTSTGDGAGSAGGTSDGSGSGSTGGGSTDGDGSGNGSGDTGGETGSGSTGGTSTGDGNGSDGGDTSTGSSDGFGSTGDGSDGGSDDGAGDTGGGTGGDNGDGGDGSGTGTGGDGGETELDAPTVTLTPKEQKIVVSWSPVEGATSYNLTWQNADGTENIINVSAEQVADGADPMLFVHAPLVANVPYTYTVTAVAADGTEAVGTPLTESALALGCTPSTYQPEGLIAYYSFEGDLSDSAGSYDLTATGDSIVYSNGCVNGKTGHFDGDGGYGYNLDFTDDNVTEVADGSFTISVWVDADEDMNKWASVFSTTAVHMENGRDDGWGQGFQLNVDGNMRPQLFACKHCGNNQKLTAPNALELNTWTHLAITIDNRTANLYVNGENVGTHDSIDTEFNRLKVGLNRYGQQPWKGYIDELMIFGDAMTDADIANIYKNTLPGTPENVVAINSVGDTVVVGWDTVEGINEYNVYYSTGGTIDTNSPYITVTGGTVVDFDNLTPRQHYTYAVAGVSPLGLGELSAPATITVDGEVEPVYGNTTVGIWYHNDYILDSYWNAPSWNSNRHQPNSNNHNHTTVIILLDDDKIKQHGMGIHNNKITKTFNVVDFTASGDMSFEQHIDIVDKHGGWSYFEYVVDTIDQRDRDIYARSAGNTHCVGVDFKTIAEYTACNPAFFQQQKDKWARDGQNKNVLLNDTVPVRNRYYTIEVKRFKGSQHYNYDVQNRNKEFVMITQKN